MALSLRAQSSLTGQYLIEHITLGINKRTFSLEDIDNLLVLGMSMVTDGSAGHETASHYLVAVSIKHLYVILLLAALEVGLGIFGHVKKIYYHIISP
jgi:hypothetical protein